MSEENKALVRRWFEEVWNKKRPEAIDEMMAPDVLCYGLSDDPSKIMKGPDEFKPFHEIFRSAFPDLHVTVEDVIAEGDKVAVRCSVSGKHSGDQLGIAASNARRSRSRVLPSCA